MSQSGGSYLTYSFLNFSKKRDVNKVQPTRIHGVLFASKRKGEPKIFIIRKQRKTQIEWKNPTEQNKTHIIQWYLGLQV